MNNTLKKANRLPFTQISNTILVSTDLSLKAKGLYAYMMSKPEGWNFTIRSMASQLKEGVDSIRVTLNELKKFNVIAYEKHNDGSGAYVIDQNPKLENPSLDNPNMGKSNRISNKDLISNKDTYKTKAKKVEAVLLPEWLSVSAWSQWVQHRKEIKKSLTPSTIKKQITLLEKNKDQHMEIIEQSIEKGWTGLFEIKTPKYSNNKKQPQVGSIGWRLQQEANLVDTEVIDVSA